MPKAYSHITERLLKLPVGRSCVLTVDRPRNYIRVVQKYEPGSVWQVEYVDSGKVVTRVR